jgi:HEAT repeat protein
MLTKGNLEERRAAAGALPNMVRVVVQLSATSASSARAPAELKDIIAVCKAIAPLAGRTLNDSDVEVRRLGAEALEQAGSTLASRAPQRRTSEDATAVADRELLTPGTPELSSLQQAIAEQLQPMARGAGDSDATVRIRVRHALEMFAGARQRMQHMSEALPPPAPKGAAAFPARTAIRVAWTQAPVRAIPDKVEEELQATVFTLIKGLSDPDEKSRLAALDALEALGPDAAPARDALVKALKDRDVFVRWAAARTLGKIGPGQGGAAVAGLAKLLHDTDFDVGLAAATALERIGPSAKEAVPSLIEATKASDALTRVAVTRTIEAIGTDAQPAVPALIVELSDPDSRVRQVAAQVLGRFGSLAVAAEPALRKAMDDSEAEVRQAASDAILNVTRGK